MQIIKYHDNKITCSCNKYLFVNKSRIKFIYTKWTKIDWATTNDVAACVSFDQSIVSFLFSVLAGPSGKYFKIKIESIVSSQASELKMVCIEAKIVKNYARIQEVANDIYDFFLFIKKLNLNDSIKLNVNEQPSENMEKCKVFDLIEGANVNLCFFQDVKLNIEVEACGAELDGSHSIACPRVKASYLPIGNDASWTRDRLELKFEAESCNSYLNINSITKLTNIFTCMIQQNVFDILQHMTKLNYDMLTEPIQKILPVSDSTKEYLLNGFSYLLGPNATVHELSSLSETKITIQTSNYIRNNTALMCKFLATTRAGLMTLALAKGKLIKMYPRIDNEINNNVRIHLVDPTINYRTQNINDIVLAGTGQPGATISIFANKTKSVGNAKVDSNGCWEYKDLILRNGTYTFFCNQICLNGHERKSNSVTIPINYPVIDPKIHPLGDVTNDNCPIISGTGEPGAIISISANGQELKGSTTVCIVCIDGSWEFMNESYFSNGHYKFQARQDCEGASKKSNIISTQIFVLPDHPWEIEKAFEKSEYIDDVILLKASVRYMLASFQIVTVGNFLEASIEKVLSIGEKNYRNIIEMLKREANNRQILHGNINCKLG